jgi:hypothetical protein
MRVGRDTDIFNDLDALREASCEPLAPPPSTSKKWQRRFVQFPWVWVERLKTAQRVSTYRLALLLVYEHWRRRGQPTIVLSKVLSQTEGLTRRSKWNAVTELEHLGLIRVERQPGKSPRVALLHMGRTQT